MTDDIQVGGLRCVMIFTPVAAHKVTILMSDVTLWHSVDETR